MVVPCLVLTYLTTSFMTNCLKINPLLGPLLLLKSIIASSLYGPRAGGGGGCGGCNVSLHTVMSSKHVACVFSGRYALEGLYFT